MRRSMLLTALLKSTFMKTAFGFEALRAHHWRAVWKATSVPGLPHTDLEGEEKTHGQVPVFLAQALGHQTPQSFSDSDRSD